MALKIVITGGTGFIGRALSQQLLDHDYHVVVLTRNVERAKSILSPRVIPVQWDGKTLAGWVKQIENASAVVNLAGDNIASGLWTRKKKQRVIESRINAGKAIVTAIRQLKSKPGVLIQASGIGYYGDRGDEILDESASRGSGYLAELAEQWEASVQDVAGMGIRLVVIRTGVVIGKGGGFLTKVMLPFRFFLGGHQGSGNQWLPWIHLQDEVGAIQFLIENKDLSGVFNLTAPDPVTSKEFFKTIGRVIRRPSWFHVPGFVLKLLLGEMAKELILSGQRAIPGNLTQAGFEFRFAKLEAAIQDILA